MTEEQIIIGLPKIIENAESIFTDATLLADSNRIERAYSLFQLSIEEIAKAFLLAGTMFFDDISKEDVQKRLIKEIRDHKFKSAKSIGLESFFYEYIKTIDIDRYEKLVLDSFKEYHETSLLNEKKNDGFYVTFNGNKFQSPSELISKQDLIKIKTKAKLRIFIGKTIIPRMTEDFRVNKKKIKEYNFEESKDRHSQVEEFIRIRRKYGSK